MSQKHNKSESTPPERRLWQKRPTYPLVDSNGELVTKNRRQDRDGNENSASARIDLEFTQDDLEELGISDTDPDLKSLVHNDKLTNPRIPTLETSVTISHSMELQFQKWRIALSADEPRCSIGRDKECDLVIPNRFASRRHGRWEWRHDQFYFCDHSFNGTYIEFDDGRFTHICRDEVVLSGSGVLSAGKPTDVDNQFIIKFVIS
ncbi:MAG: FHA domain-containing protein [Pseudomonadota bacterium]